MVRKDLDFERDRIGAMTVWFVERSWERMCAPTLPVLPVRRTELRDMMGFMFGGQGTESWKMEIKLWD